MTNSVLRAGGGIMSRAIIIVFALSMIALYLTKKGKKNQ